MYTAVTAGIKYQDFFPVRAYALEPESRARVLCARVSDPSPSPLHSIERWTIRGHSPHFLANPSTHPFRSVAEHLLVHTAEVYQVTITVLFPQRPLAPSLGVEPTMDGMTGVIRGMPNWKAVGPDSLPAEVLKLDHPEFIRYFHNLLVNVWSTGEVAQQWKDATIKVLHKEKDRSDCNNFLGISVCLLYTSPSPRDQRGSRMPSSA